MIINKDTIKSDYKNIYSLQKEKIGIPIFQRFYDWKEPQIIQFKQDLLEAVKNKNKQLYFLDFIYYKDNNKVMLADGQQRIVSVNNLIKVIKDVAKERNIRIPKIELFDISYDIFSNDKKYQNHISNYPTAPFKIVYLSFKSFVEEHLDIISDLVDVIKNNIFIYLKKCRNADDAFEIFQQINTGGKPLSKDEVIKTALDQYSDAYQIKIDTSKTKDIRQSIISYYKLVKDEPDKKFDNMAIITFLKDFITKDKSSYQSFVDTITLLDTLRTNPIKYVINYINRATLLDVLNILAMKNIDTNKKKEYMTKLMMPLCLMSICLTMNGGSPTSFRYLLNGLIKMIKDDKKIDELNCYLLNYVSNDQTSWTISKEVFSEKLGALDTPKGIKKALLIMDVIDKNVSGNVDVELINLEHIYPQNPCLKWAQNGWPANIESQKLLIDNIGNYLLLSESVNKSIQNSYITEKVNHYTEIIKRDKLLQTPLNTVDFNAFEENMGQYIIDRQKEMANRIRNELPFGKVLIKE